MRLSLDCFFDRVGAQEALAAGGAAESHGEFRISITDGLTHSLPRIHFLARLILGRRKPNMFPEHDFRRSSLIFDNTVEICESVSFG